MSQKRFVYVGGFEDTLKQEQLHSLFLTFGEILSIQLPLEPNSTKNRGFAIIEFELIQDAEEAIDNMHNCELGGRVLTVNTAKPFLDQKHEDLTSLNKLEALMNVE
eukprot:gene4652-8225_t